MMGRPAWRLNTTTALLGVALALISGFAADGTWAAGQEAGGPPELGGPNVVLSGGYTCSLATTGYYTGDDTPPATYTELSDALSMSTTGGPDLVRAVPPQSIGPGYGGRTPITGLPQTGALPIAGFGTGHSFEGGTLEDCVRFAQTIARTSGALGCTTSEVRRRQPPVVPFSWSASTSFSFVCEAPAAPIVHLMGEMNRAVLGLRLQPAP